MKNNHLESGGRDAAGWAHLGPNGRPKMGPAVQPSVLPSGSSGKLEPERRRTGGGETGRAIVIGGTWRLFSSKTPAPLIASKKYARGGAKTLPLKSAWLVARQRQSATRVTIHDASAGASSSALATDRQVRLAGTARGRCALSGLSRLGPLFVPAAGTLLRMDTLVDDDGEVHIGTVHVEASAFLVQAVVHHLGKRHNCTTSSDFE